MQLWMLSSFILDSLAVAAQSLVAVELGKVRPHLRGPPQQCTCLLCPHCICCQLWHLLRLPRQQTVFRVLAWGQARSPS